MRATRIELEADIRRLKRALHQEGESYQLEPDPPGLFRPGPQEVAAIADWLEGANVGVSAVPTE